MTIRLRDHFDGATLERGRDYAQRGLVVAVEAQADGSLAGRVANGQGTTYRQRISLARGGVEGVCSCPVGRNCKHVAAALLVWGERQDRRPALAAPVLGWLDRVRDRAAVAPPNEPPPGAPDAPPEGYPEHVKDRLLYLLAPRGGDVKIEICKGRINSTGTALNKGIRRHDVIHALRSAAPAQFIRPIDIELLSALAQARLWEAQYNYGLPDLLRPRADAAFLLVRRLCETGRFLHDAEPDALLSWSDARPEPRVGWRITASGGQKLGFEDASGQPLDLCGLAGSTLWIDREQGLVGALSGVVGLDALRLVEGAPEIAAHETEALAAALPERLAGLSLPRPRVIGRTRRAARRRFARLTLGAESARDGPRYWGNNIQLPTLTLRFVYDGQEVAEADAAEPTSLEDGGIVALARDEDWEAACAARLMAAGALPVDDLESHVPGEKMLKCDYVFATGEMNSYTRDISDLRFAVDFAFRTVPALRAEGWEVTEIPKWPYRLSADAAKLTVSTEREGGEAFQGNDWFSLGFKAEIGGGMPTSPRSSPPFSNRSATSGRRVPT